MLANDEIGLEAPQSRRNNALEAGPPRMVSRTGCQGNAYACSVAGPRAEFVGTTCTWKQGATALVDGYGEHIRVVVKAPLDPVTMVRIDVDISNAPAEFTTSIFDTDSRIVVHTKSSRLIPHCVVQATAKVYGMATFAFTYRLHRIHGGSDPDCGSSMHAGKGRGIRSR